MASKSYMRTVNYDFNLSSTLTLKMTTAQGVETLVTVHNSSIQDYGHLNDHAQPTYEMTLGFKPFIESERF